MILTNTFRCTSCHGLEIRVPFLDKRFVDFVARLPPSFKLAPRRIEKHLLRIAFQGWLPDDVLWRSKVNKTIKPSHLTCGIYGGEGVK